MSDDESGGAAINRELELFGLYNKAPYLSIKYDSYFQVYEETLRRYVGKQITFVEVGILNGGSLFMWREYFGPGARIIGIDLNPAAERWRADGFEIFIGDQADPSFWREFYRQVGAIDVLMDDGGHRNSQQILTVSEAIPNVRDGGTIIVEDIHGSYMREFGNPSRYSFLNFARRLVDSINSRHGPFEKTATVYSKSVYSVAFYESIVVLGIDSQRCFRSAATQNRGAATGAEDFRYRSLLPRGLSELPGALTARLGGRERLGVLKKIPFLVGVYSTILRLAHSTLSRIENRRLRKFFRDEA
jgi:hypothetical protein